MCAFKWMLLNVIKFVSLCHGCLVDYVVKNDLKSRYTLCGQSRTSQELVKYCSVRSYACNFHQGTVLWPTNAFNLQAPCVLYIGQAFRYSPENAFYIFIQQIFFIIWYLLDHQPSTSWVYYTTSCNIQSIAPEDGKNNCPKHVELTGIINKPLLLHLVGCLYYLYSNIFFWDLLNNLNLFLYRMSCIS